MLLAYGFLRRVFEIFEKYKTPIDMITTSEVAVSVTIDDVSHLNQIIKELEVLGSVEVDQNQSIICIVGNMVSETRGAVKSVMDSFGGFPYTNGFLWRKQTQRLAFGRQQVQKRRAATFE